MLSISKTHIRIRETIIKDPEEEEEDLEEEAKVDIKEIEELWYVKSVIRLDILHHIVITCLIILFNLDIQPFHSHTINKTTKFLWEYDSYGCYT